MTPEKWAQIKNIFLEALTQPMTARTEFVQRECATDPEMKFEVGRLLEAAGAADIHSPWHHPSIRGGVVASDAE